MMPMIFAWIRPFRRVVNDSRAAESFATNRAHDSCTYMGAKTANAG